MHKTKKTAVVLTFFHGGCKIVLYRNYYSLVKEDDNGYKTFRFRAESNGRALGGG